MIIDLYYEAAAIFDDNIDALAIAIGSLMAKANKTKDVSRIKDDLMTGGVRLEKYKTYFKAVMLLDGQQVEYYKKLAALRFCAILGELKTIEYMLLTDIELKSVVAKREISNLTKIQQACERIKAHIIAKGG